MANSKRIAENWPRIKELMGPLVTEGYGLNEARRAGKRAFLHEQVKKAATVDDLRDVLLDLFEDRDNLL